SSANKSAIDVTFSEAVNPSTVTPATVAVTNPGGAAVTPITVTDIDPVFHRLFHVTFAPQTLNGLYTVTVGPGVTDRAGNTMDQNQNGVNGETPGDVFAGRVYLQSGTNSAPSIGAGSEALPLINENDFNSA